MQNQATLIKPPIDSDCIFHVNKKIKTTDYDSTAQVIKKGTNF